MKVADTCTRTLDTAWPHGMQVMMMMQQRPSHPLDPPRMHKCIASRIHHESKDEPPCSSILCCSMMRSCPRYSL